MWGQNSQTITQTRKLNGVSPILIKNFNPFEILEPQKKEKTLDKLIEIDTNDVSTSECNVPSGSLNDVKTNLDLIDLYQNILVSPQHISSKNEEYETKHDMPSTSNDFSDFFLKQGTTVKSKPLDEYIKTPELKNILSNTEILDGFSTEVTNISPATTYLDVDEDLIDEVLFTKNVEKQFMNQKINVQMKPTKYKVKDNTEKFNVREFANSMHSEKLASLQNEPCTKSFSNPVPRKVDFLHEFKKDKKLFAKKCFKISDAEKSGFTKGANLYEKSIVLPQVMERLNARKRVLDERKQLKPRLVLDAGTASSNIQESNNSDKSYLQTTDAANLSVNYNPIVLMEDCNKQRLIAYNQRVRFDNFVKYGKCCK